MNNSKRGSCCGNMARSAGRGTARRNAGNALVTLLVIILVLLAVAAAGGWFLLQNNVPVASNFVKRAVYSPEQYYDYVTEEGIQGFSAGVAELYGSRLTEKVEINHLREDLHLQLRLGDEARQLLGTTLETDMEWLRSPSADFTLELAEKNMALGLGVGLNGKDLLSLDMLYDMETWLAAARAPQLSDRWVAVDISEYMENLPPEEQLALSVITSDEVSETATRIMKALPEKAMVETLLKRYLTMAAESVRNVSKTNGSLSAGGVTANCVVLTGTITDAQTREAARKIASALAQDADVAKMLRDMETALDMEFYEDFAADMRKAAESEDRGSDSESETQMTLWVDNLGRICGLRLEGTEEAQDPWGLTFALPMSGTTLGLEFSASGDGSAFAFSGKGQLNGTALEGDFRLDVDGEEYCGIQVGNMDLVELLGGGFRLNVTVAPTRELWLNGGMDISTARILEAFSLALDIEAGKNSGNDMVNSTWTVLQDGREYAALTLRGSADFSASPKTMPEGIEPEEWLAETVAEGTLATFVAGLRDTDIPEEYVDELEGYVNLLSYFYG